MKEMYFPICYHHKTHSKEILQALPSVFYVDNITTVQLPKFHIIVHQGSYYKHIIINY